MKLKSNAPTKLTDIRTAESRRYPPFTRFDQRSSATTDDFDTEGMGIAPKE